MGVLFDDRPIFERSGLTLVGIATQIDGLIRVLGQEPPFDACRKTRPTPPAQVRFFYLGSDFLRLERRQRLARCDIAIMGQVDIKLVNIGDIFMAQ